MVQPITFLIPGQEQNTRGMQTDLPLPAGLTPGQVKHAVRVSAQRGAGNEVPIHAMPGDDVVVLHIAHGPVLVLHPETARDLFLAQSDLKRDAKQADLDPIPVPAQLQWRGLERSDITARGAPRGLLGDVMLSAVQVVTGLAKDPAADFAASEVVKRVDAQVDAGVYPLAPEALPKLKGSGTKLDAVPAAPNGEPLLVLVHGTFSETHGTFGKLWAQHPQQVRSLFAHYGNRVYGFDHPTLGASPIGNAQMLARTLPKGARLHLLTHSRGGLVAEVLARVCAQPDLTDDDDYRYFAGADYQSQREDLKTLAALVKERALKIERVVRVACPARGTLLASKRLDAYVSVFKWTLEGAGIPVAPELVDFLGAVAQRRADPELLPGLAAQIPDSPLVQWLHAAEQALPGELRVIAGDVQGDSVTAWLKTLLADAYYWTDNDLVVQTRSMYGGAPRGAGASFMLDQGGNVSHFNYFSNERTTEAIINALTQDTPLGFRTIGPLSWAGESSGGVRGARRSATDERLASDKPAVFILPGILGSNLKLDGKRIWLSWRILNGLNRLHYHPGQPDGVEPDGPIDATFEDLEEFLSLSHEVIPFAYDWRQPMEIEAQRLANAVEAALAMREKNGQPVRLLAHSMGGLLARTMQLERPQVWQRMMARPGARLLMLGTPNGGSWSPMQTLSGDDTFGNTLIAFGAPLQDHTARQMMASFPGFIQLQAALQDAALGLDRSQTWQNLADDDLKRVRQYNWWHHDSRQLNAYIWGVPPQEVLDSALALRKRLDTQRAGDLSKFKDQLLLVVGQSRFTPDGYEVGEAGLFYLDAQDGGDGRVTLQNALLPGIRTWKLDCEHGKLPKEKTAFDAYLDLLEHGETARLTPLAATPERGASTDATLISAPAAPHVRSRPAHTLRANAPPQSTQELYALTNRTPEARRSIDDVALRVTVVNGNLMFAQPPLMLGHYRATTLTGSESALDHRIGGVMSASLGMGQYPDLPRTQQIFINQHCNPENPLQAPRPQAVIVVGLGEEGKLRATDLVHTVRQGVIAWAQRVAETCADMPVHCELAAALIGSGGMGISAGQAARLIAQGVQEANQRLRNAPWPGINHLHLIELYLDRATEAWRAMTLLAATTPGQYLVDDTVQTGIGALPRPIDASYRGAGYDFISAITQINEHSGSVISYTLDTKRARAEVRAQAMQGPLLRELIANASNDQNADEQIGRTLFQLLVPIEMESFLGGTEEMQIELDDGTAGIPWELLDTTTGSRDEGDARPWAIRAKLLRRLRTANFRTQVIDATIDSHVLVIGEPQCDPTRYPSLPGARAEAQAVLARFTAPGALNPDWVQSLISGEGMTSDETSARVIVNTLLARDWRIVHIAGHGEPPQEDGDPRGVVLSHGAFLGPREIGNMRVVPELVFVNCCHLAAFDATHLSEVSASARYDRTRFAANVAEALIDIGVHCVIAAGWAVEDDAANTFATTFYDALLRGERFIDAVAHAREAAWHLGGNTWAAYQCYGDPDWFFWREGTEKKRSPRPLAEEFASVASASALILALDTLTVNEKFQKTDPEKQRANLRYLEARFASLWGPIGMVAEAFARAWEGTNDKPQAIGWYEAALAANDGSASMKAGERLGYLRAQLAWEAITPLADAAARTFTDDEQATLSAARTQLNNAITRLTRLTQLQSTMKRESLCGLAYQRLSMLESMADQPSAEIAAITHMKECFSRAETLARSDEHAEFFYPTLYRMAAEWILSHDQSEWAGFDLDTLGSLRQGINQKIQRDPDAWSMAASIWLQLLDSLAHRALTPALEAIERECEALHRHATDSVFWQAVREQGRFVLWKYAIRATPMEQSAIRRLLNGLDIWVGES